MDDSIGAIVMLDEAEANLMLHVLSTFERLLRYGHLNDHQLGLLTPDSTGEAESSADLLMANVVSEAAMTIRLRLS